MCFCLVFSALIQDFSRSFVSQYAYSLVGGEPELFQCLKHPEASLIPAELN